VRPCSAHKTQLTCALAALDIVHDNHKEDGDAPEHLQAMPVTESAAGSAQTAYHDADVVGNELNTRGVGRPRSIRSNTSHLHTGANKRERKARQNEEQTLAATNSAYLREIELEREQERSQGVANQVAPRDSRGKAEGRQLEELDHQQKPARSDKYRQHTQHHGVSKPTSRSKEHQRGHRKRSNDACEKAYTAMQAYM
jgi:hypothetical protein